MRSQTFGILSFAIKYEIINAFFVEILHLRKMSSASGNFMPRPRPTGALLLEPTGGLPSPDPLFCVVQEEA